jgi:hypothetical protein
LLVFVAVDIIILFADKADAGVAVDVGVSVVEGTGVGDGVGRGVGAMTHNVTT